MNRFRKIFVSVMLTSILATGCGAANAAPTQQVETPEATTAETQEAATTAETQEAATTAETQEAATTAETQEAATTAETQEVSETQEETTTVVYPDGEEITVRLEEDAVFIILEDRELKISGEIPQDPLPKGRVKVDDLSQEWWMFFIGLHN